MPEQQATPQTAAVITVSDSVSQGKRKDESGPALAAALTELGYDIAAWETVPDSQPAIERVLCRWCGAVSLVVTTGGTGIAKRDVTPEATRAVAEKIVDGLAELMRSSGMRHTPFAVLSRGLAAVRGRSLILNVPGSPKAAVESLHAVAKILPHALDLLAGKTEH